MGSHYACRPLLAASSERHPHANPRLHPPFRLRCNDLTLCCRFRAKTRQDDAHRKAPAFPFGHGLSPGADFAYANLSIVADAPSPTDASTHAAGADVALTFAVTNKGARAGVTVVQAYVAYPAAYGEPPRQLRAFSKLTLAPGSTQHVRLALPPRAFSVWDAAVHAWVRAKGSFDLFVGESSRDLRLRGKVSLP